MVPAAPLPFAGTWLPPRRLAPNPPHGGAGAAGPL